MNERTRVLPCGHDVANESVLGHCRACDLLYVAADELEEGDKMTRDTSIDLSMYPRCGCPPRPPLDAPWRDHCTWHIEHYRAALDGRGAHREGHPKVVRKMVDRWLDALLLAERNGTAEEPRTL